MKQTILLITALLFAGFTSCENGNEKKERIAVVISTLNNPWFVVLGQTAVERCEQLGYEAILFNPTDADGSAVNAKAAARQDIPVFCSDSPRSHHG